MKKLLSELKRLLEEGQSAVLVTVTASSGATPRGAGARMLVSAQGRVCGTIGGGAVEFRSTKLADDALKSRQSCTSRFQLSSNQVADLGMICGGNVTVYFQYIDASRKDIEALAERALELMEEGKSCWLVTEISDGSEWGLSLYEDGGPNPALPQPVLDVLNKPLVNLTVDGKQYYAEQLTYAGRVFIFGGGHVAQELVPVLSHLDFRCIVLDDRPEFANDSLFPTAEEIIQADFDRIADVVSIGEPDFVVVMTRGHQYDATVQKQVLRTPAQYIGVIGSRQKAQGVARALMESGFTQEDVSRIKTPIGLSIKAQTPAEIAISIAAELIERRAERNGL